MPQIDIGPLLWRDLAFMRNGGTDARIAMHSLFAIMLGSDDGRPPSYGRFAQAVWTVVNAGQPAPVLEYFDWGGSHRGARPLRIWYLSQPGREPRGVGAFAASPAPPYAEQGEVTRRVTQMLAAPVTLV
jgi:hypothetical protein